MSLTEKDKFDLKKFIKELEKFKGRHTELVTVYIPAEYDINKIINQLAQEQGTASNIKSSATRNNVTSALERMIQHLRLFKKTPDHGLAVFSGNVAEREGQSDLKVWSLEPPIPLNQKLYRCDKEFVLEPLMDMIDIKEYYGMVVLDRRDAMIALLKGKTLIPLRQTHSEVPGKMKAGGQSSQRFARLRLGAIKDHYKKIAEYMKEAFLGRPGLKGIILGGPGVTIDDFLNKDYLTGDIKKLIIGTKDLSYTGEFGLQELLDRSDDILAKEEVTAEKKIMNRFFELLNTNMKKVSYGENQVIKLIQLGMVDIVILSETLPEEKIEMFEIEAQKMGSSVRIISVETREGVQLKEIGGVAAILRYEYEE
ncbi:MAG: peptide chain release factor aRF-1 [Candidatus Woesearchaeota archaeon]